MNRQKGGQSANNAAVVVILIAVMIILYILFLPPADRAAILGEDSGSGNGGTGGGSVARLTLMTKTPGTVYPAGANMVEHTIPSFLVFTVTNANELKRVDSLYVKNSPFNMKNGEVLFYYDEKTTKDLKLSFNVVKREGRLKIVLNDHDIFEGDLGEGSPAPLSLPIEYLKGKNTLVFEVSSPGVLFWQVNEYQLESVVVSAKVTDYTGATSEQHFSLADTEYQKMESASLEFLPDCPPKEQGQLQILLNGRPVYTSFPDCGVKAKIELSKEYLKAGDNSLIATTNTGSFLMDAPKITTFLKEIGQPVFYFTATPAVLDAVYSGRRNAVLSIRFADSSTLKRGVVEVNGFKIGFETQDYLFQTPLDPESLLEGSNGLKVVPLSGPLDIVDLRVDVV